MLRRPGARALAGRSRPRPAPAWRWRRCRRAPTAPPRPPPGTSTPPPRPTASPPGRTPPARRSFDGTAGFDVEHLEPVHVACLPAHAVGRAGQDREGAVVAGDDLLHTQQPD